MDVKIIKEKIEKISGNVAKVIVGKDEVIKLILSAILAEGHVLVEDNPGTGKTVLAKAFAKSINGEFRRVQFTPDLMPSDITGLNVYNQKNGEFNLVKGPVFTNVLLADEINRATPRTQSSLLEAMGEGQVSIDGETMELAKPFVVIATENPIETTGTYPLPEAQLDRFLMKISMGENSVDEELAIIDRFIQNQPLKDIQSVCTIDEITEMQSSVKDVFVHDCVRKYLVDIVMATRESSKLTCGASTRGMLALLRASQAFAMINGRNYVEPDDTRYLAPFVLGHRVVAYNGMNYFTQTKELIEKIVADIPVPVEKWQV